ncbi:23S rRNA pseudouridine(1911/1915/1917) synthase [Rhodocyclus tenuis]|nr:23S rRNA pseudouridine(1911/1915/1917) synthase [Rhodocyclus tenuis]
MPVKPATERTDYSAANPLIALSVPADCGGERLDRILARLLPQHSRNRLQTWIREGRVRLAGEPLTETKRKLWGGESLEIDAAADEHAESSAPEDIPLDIVYEDETLLVINKPAGLVVHPGNGNWHGTLLNALLHHAPALAGIPRAGIVHRLDKDTSGLLVVAKTLAAQTDLVRQLQARTVKRRYRALLRGELTRDGTVDAPIGRHPTLRTRMAVVSNGKPARTHYHVLERFIGCTLVDCALETGRTHQIRVHMTSIGHPLVGDAVYGGGASRIPVGALFHRQALHAFRLGLVHPENGRSLQWTAPLPDDFAELLEGVREEAAAAAEALALASGEEDDFDDWDEADGPQVFYVRGDGDFADADDDPDAAAYAGEDGDDELDDEYLDEEMVDDDPDGDAADAANPIDDAPADQPKPPGGERKSAHGRR